MELFSLSYISKKSELLDVQDINSIYEQSLNWNKINNITGMLIEYKNHFLQYIEGPPEEVHNLFSKIRKDSRHNNVEIFQYKEIKTRLFTSWNMLYKNLDQVSVAESENKNQYIRDRLDDIIDNKKFWEGISVIEELSNL